MTYTVDGSSYIYEVAAVYQLTRAQSNVRDALWYGYRWVEDWASSYDKDFKIARTIA